MFCKSSTAMSPNLSTFQNSSQVDPCDPAMLNKRSPMFFRTAIQVFFDLETHQCIGIALQTESNINLQGVFNYFQLNKLDILSNDSNKATMITMLYKCRLLQKHFIIHTP